MPKTVAPIHPWEREYRHPKLVTLHDEPQATVRRFFRFVKKEAKMDWDHVQAIDAGCGTGRNAIAMAEKGATLWAFDISKTAISLAKARAKERGVAVDFSVQSLADVWPIPSASVDIVLDVTASNALTTKERERYLGELSRVMKRGAWLYLRTLAIEGDAHAKNLLKTHPGTEPQRYVLPSVGIEETVFTEEDLRHLLGKHGLTIVQMKRESGYTHLGGTSYKRQFWVVYAQKST